MKKLFGWVVSVAIVLCAVAFWAVATGMDLDGPTQWRIVLSIGTALWLVVLWIHYRLWPHIKRWWTRQLARVS